MSSGLSLGTILDKVDSGGSFWLPPNASVTTQFVDPVFHYILALTTLFFVGIVVAMIYLAIRYRKRGDDDRTSPVAGNHKLEVIWSIIPAILLGSMFWMGWRGYVNLSVPPGDAMEVRVTGQKWVWTFEYPLDGVTVKMNKELLDEADAKGEELFVAFPKGKPVKVIGRSVDVLHSMFFPAFRVKKDVVPNRYTSLWFEPTLEGDYNFFCTEFCGTDHSRMIGRYKVMEQADFDAWIAEMKKNSAQPVDGSQVYAQNGCAACHSIDGVAGVGPSLNGIWGKDELLTDGATAKVDENYVRESVVDPTAKVVNGFAPVMPTFKGRISDAEIDALIKYLKDLQ